MKIVNEQLDSQTQVPEEQRQVCVNKFMRRLGGTKGPKILRTHASNICRKVLENVFKKCDTSKACEISKPDESLLKQIEQLKEQIQQAQSEVDHSRAHVNQNSILWTKI